MKITCKLINDQFIPPSPEHEYSIIHNLSNDEPKHFKLNQHTTLANLKNYHSFPTVLEEFVHGFLVGSFSYLEFIHHNSDDNQDFNCIIGHKPIIAGIAKQLAKHN